MSNPQDEILAAACNALDKAHALLSRVVFYGGMVLPHQIVDECQSWIDGEYDPGERLPKPCEHIWKKAVLDDSIGCTRCGIPRDVSTTSPVETPNG